MHRTDTRMFLLVVLALIASSGRSAAEVSGVSAPLLAWSGRALLSAGGAQYQSAQAEDVLHHLVLGALGRPSTTSAQLISSQAGSHNKADLVVVYLGNQVDASALRQAARQPALQALADMVTAAKSSVVLPFLKHEGESLLQAVKTQLQGTNLAFQAVGCFSDSQDVAADVKKAVGLDQSLEVLLVCSPPVQGHSTEALKSEVALVEAVHAAVEQSGKHALFVYTNQASMPRSARRALQASGATLSGFGSYTDCGPLCKTQVAWLQGMLALTVLALAMCAGMTCLHLLNGPSRFETAKEHQQ